MVTHPRGDKSRLEDIENEVSTQREVNGVERRPETKKNSSKLKTLGKNLGDMGSRIYDRM